MQTEPYMPPAPIVRVQKKTNWVATVVAGSLAVVIAVVGIVLVQSKSGQLRETTASLEGAQAEIERLESDLDDATDSLATSESSLADVKSELGDVRADLSETDRAWKTSLKCSVAMLDAWYTTTDASYSATGLALQRAVYSRRCRIIRAAYEGANPSLA